MATTRLTVVRPGQGAPRLRALEASEVIFAVDCEPECEGPEGAFATGNDAADRALEREIRSAAEGGNPAAWCVVVVKASWTCGGRQYEGHDAVGACSFLCEPEALAGELEAFIDDHGMRESALAALNDHVRSEHRQASALERALGWDRG